MNPISYFQQWLNSTLNTDNNTSATIIISLMVFGGGLIFTGLGYFIRRLLVKRNYKTTFKYQLQEIIKATRLQSDNFKRFSESLFNEETLNLSLSAIPFLNRIYDIPASEINSIYVGGFNWFNRKRKIVAISYIYKSLATIENIENTVRETFSNFTEKFSYIENQRNQSIQSLIHKIDYLLASIDNPNQFLKEYISDLDPIVSKWQKQETALRVMKINAHENLILPLKELNHHYLNVLKYRRTEIIDLNHDVLSVEFHYKNLLKLTDVNKRLFFLYSIIYKGRSRILRMAIKRL